MDLKKKIKITLISPYSNISSTGLRIISSYLKMKGHSVKIIFLNFSNGDLSDVVDDKLILDLIEICQYSDLIGFSLMTNHFIICKQLTVKLREKLDIPIIWGGIHPTVKPEECLDYADIVCTGEGEEATLELANKLALGEKIADINNLSFKMNGIIIRNNVRNLEENLDKYPFQDYDINTHYILQKNRLVKMTESILKEILPKNTEIGGSNVEYYIMTTRNCPYNCTYCCNNALRRIYKNKGKFVRKRSAQDIIQELLLVKKAFPFIKQILITDDTFFVRSIEELEDFCNLYKSQIRLPWRCYVSPLTLDENKLKLSINAGLFRVSMGIQSFSYQTLKNVYNRPVSKNIILKKIAILDKYKKSIPHPVYHFIIDNPYETEEAKTETKNFISSLPKEVVPLLFPMTFYPGTDLYERAIRDGIITDEIKEIYLKFLL